MESPKIISVEKENALRRLENENWKRGFVDAVKRGRKCFLHVRVLKKWSSTTFTVRELPFQEQLVSEDNMQLNLQNGFETLNKRTLSKISPGTELIIRGFEIQGDRKEIKKICVNYTNFAAEIWCVERQTEDGPDVVACDSKEVYMYTKLNELSIQNKVNVYGIVKAVRHYKPDRRDRYKAKIFITDKALGTFDGVEFTVVSKNEEVLKSIKPFDIVRFHRAKVECCFGDPNEFRGFGEVSVKGFHFLVFSNENDSNEPISTSITTTFTNGDKESVKFLREWSTKTRNFDKNGCFSCLPLRRFAVPGEYQDLLVQVIAIGSMNGLSESVVFRVWDGSSIGIPLMNKLVDFRKETRNIFDFDEVLNRIDKVNSLSVDIFVYDEHTDYAEKIKAGDVVKFVNVHAYKKILPVPTLTLHGAQYTNVDAQYGRGITILDSKSRLVKAFKKKLTKIIKGNDLDDDDDDDEDEDDDGDGNQGHTLNRPATLSSPQTSTAYTVGSNVILSGTSNVASVENSVDNTSSATFVTARSIEDDMSPPRKILCKRIDSDRNDFENSIDSSDSDVYSQPEQCVPRSLDAKNYVDTSVQTKDV